MRIARLVLGFTSLLALLGCGKDDAQQPKAPKQQLGKSEVALSASQIKMIRVGEVQSARFQPSAEVIGTVSFAEDPQVLQAEATFLSNAAADRQMSSERKRASLLQATNGVSVRELEQAKTDAATAHSNYLSSRDALIALGKTESQLNALLSKGTLPTPAKKGSKFLSLNPTESDSASFKAGMPLTATLVDAGNTVFNGRILEVYATVDPTSHRVTMRALVSDPQNELRPGMLVQAAVATGPAVSAPAVPDPSIVREGDGTLMVWTTTDDKIFEQKKVHIGTRQNGQAQVLDGLRVGQRVVTDGGILLDNMLQGPTGD